MTASHVLDSARRVAAERLAPVAAAVDATGVLPPGHLEALAAAGLYGVRGPRSAGGLEADRGTALGVTEILAEACLATAFVWVQHQSVVRALSRSGEFDDLLAGLCAGTVRAGIAIGGIRPGAEPLRADPDAGGWRLRGDVPWVTGWGLVDLLHVAARDPQGDVVWLLVDASDAPGLTARPVELTAVQASRTVTLSFDGHPAGDRLTGRTTYAQWQAADVGSLRGNGSLALGLARRCASAEGSPAAEQAVGPRIEQVRRALDLADDAADADRLAEARAAASALAWTAAGRLALAAGGAAVVAGSDADRAVREAAFLLVFGSRPPIRAALRARLLP